MAHANSVYQDQTAPLSILRNDCKKKAKFMPESMEYLSVRASARPWWAKMAIALKPLDISGLLIDTDKI